MWILLAQLVKFIFVKLEAYVQIPLLQQPKKKKSIMIFKWMIKDNWHGRDL